MKKILFPILLILSLFIPEKSFALAVGTHEIVNKFTLDNMSSSINRTIKNYNLSDGINTPIPPNQKKTIRDYIAAGGIAEDNTGLLRYANHYHNPLDDDWKTSGFKGDPSLNWVPFLNSAIHQLFNADPVWAQNGGTYSNNNSWPSARDYFYNALIATDEDTRNSNFVNCFTSVGQVMHLLQDMSVPAHVRDESHAIGNIYEIWVDNRREDGNLVDYLTPLPSINYDAIIKKGTHPEAPIPIAGLFDADVYNGSNPDATANTTVGLSEYASANFFSEDTMFSSQLSYPAFSSATTVEVAMPYSSQTKRTYYLKNKDGEKNNGSHSTGGYLLATVGFLKDYVTDKILKLHKNDFGLPGLTRIVKDKLNDTPGLDDYCYEDYAHKLLPRAVGYSKALLQYFFRGDIDAVDADTTTDVNGNINGVKMKVKNKTPGANGQTEDIGAGNLVVSYQYKSGSSTVYGKSDPPLAFDNYSGHTYEFTGFTSPIPHDATDKKYMLVYRGKLGAEDDAVAGKSFKPITCIIDNWERETVLWVPADPCSNLSISDTSLVGNKSMLIQVAGGNNAEKKLYDRQPVTYNWGWGWGYQGFNNCMYEDEIGQRIIGGAGNKITRLTLYMNNFEEYNAYSVTLRPRIYIDGGAIPGSLFAEGDIQTVNGADLPGNYDTKPVTFTFPNGGVKLPEGNNYNISVKAISFSGVAPDGNPAPNVPIIADGNSFLFGTETYDCETYNYVLYPQCGYAAIIYAKDSLPLATRNIPVDCSKYNSFKITIKSNLAGNVVNFVYGADVDHTATSSLTVDSSWQAVEVPISQDVDKSKLAYFAFELGRDGIDENGKSKENEILVDQIEAE